MPDPTTPPPAAETPTHTAGPWSIEPKERREHPLFVQSQEGDRIARCDGINIGDFVTPAQCKANARLISAAPELLAELEAVEWAGLEDHPDGGHYGACPCCGGGDPDNPQTPDGHEGHEDDCSLAAALVKARGTPKPAPPDNAVEPPTVPTRNLQL